MKIVCTKCGSEEVYIEMEEPQKMPDTQTMDEMVNNLYKPIPLVYKMTTWKCKKCGYSVSR